MSLDCRFIMRHERLCVFLLESNMEYDLEHVKEISQI